MNNSQDLSYINQKMPVFKGCTLQEAGLIFSITYFICLIGLSIVSIDLFGTVLLGVALSIFPSIVISWALLIKIGRLKEGKPLGYSEIKINLWLSSLGLKKNPYITQSRAWSIGRYD